MIAYFYGYSGSAPPNNATNYAPIEVAYYSSAFNATEANAYQPIPHALTLDLLTVTLTTAPSAGKSWAFTVMQNGNPTSLTVTIADTNKTATDSSHSVSFNAGDTISIQSVPTGTPTAAGTTMWTTRQSAPGMFANLTSTVGQALTSAAGVGVLGIQGNTITSNNDVNASAPAPFQATITNMYVVASTAIAAGSWTINFRKNTSSVGPSAVLTSSATSANDTTHPINVLAGDLINLQLTPSASTTAFFGLGLSIIPSIPGASWMLSGVSSNSASTTVANYTVPFGSNSLTTPESSRQIPVPALNIFLLYVKLTASPGSGKSYVFTINKNSVASAIALKIQDATTIDSLPGNASFISGDLLDLSTTPTGTPAGPVVKVGIAINAQGAQYGSPVTLNNYQFVKVQDNGNGVISVTEKLR